MSKSTKYSQSRTDTLIGAGMRVEGDMDFTGVLRIQGDIQGKVACDRDSNGTIVVSKSGNVTGTINAPRIVVSGHVHGPVHSSESIEIQQGGSFTGDADYRTIEVHAGGVIEGALTPRAPIDGDRSRQEHRVQPSETVEEQGYPFADAAQADSGSDERFWNWRKLGVTAALLVAVIAAVLVYRDTAPVATPVADVVLRADSSMQVASATPPSPADSSGPKDGTGNLAGNALPPTPSADADTKSVTPAPATDLPEIDPDTIVIVQGVNPGKPAGVFSVIAREASVLFKKKRQDTDEGTRIEISRGATENIAIANNEIFRVAKGKNMIIYYQGRKVASKTIEEGSWMSFVPQSPGGTGDKK
ncbi:MAG: polymer-forming cytoskeletal protein [Proteobacteria bacterium]|nr:polymer-forming cytoskeletal protein [Pseudomonadota bacterium]